MLNCCIQKRIKRENIQPLSEDSDDQNLQIKCQHLFMPQDSKNRIFLQFFHNFSDESEDEEFFDCQTESKEKEDGGSVKVNRISLWNQPEGRLRKFNNLRLIETGDYMYIPITQVSPSNSFLKIIQKFALCLF